MRVMCAAVLALESVVLLLTTPVLISVTEVSTGLALVVGLGLAGLAILAATLLRSSAGYLLGRAVQAGAVAVGFWVSVMFVLGAAFAVLWVTALVLGRRVEEAKTARAAADGSVGGPVGGPATPG